MFVPTHFVSRRQWKVAALWHGSVPSRPRTDGWLIHKRPELLLVMGERQQRKNVAVAMVMDVKGAGHSLPDWIRKPSSSDDEASGIRCESRLSFPRLVVRRQRSVHQAPRRYGPACWRQASHTSWLRRFCTIHPSRHQHFGCLKANEQLFASPGDRPGRRRLRARSPPPMCRIHSKSPSAHTTNRRLPDGQAASRRRGRRRGGLLLIQRTFRNIQASVRSNRRWMCAGRCTIRTPARAKTIGRSCLTTCANRSHGSRTAAASAIAELFPAPRACTAHSFVTRGKTSSMKQPNPAIGLPTRTLSAIL